LAIAAIVVVALFVLVFGPARAVRNASSGETQLVPRKLASFCFAFNPCPVTCCGNVKSHIVKPSCHSLHESLMQNSLTLAMVAVVTVVGFAVVFGLVHAADAARGKPQVALSPATASSCLASHPSRGDGIQEGEDGASHVHTGRRGRHHDRAAGEDAKPAGAGRANSPGHPLRSLRGRTCSSLHSHSILQVGQT
jgi:hypothetical protein